VKPPPAPVDTGAPFPYDGPEALRQPIVDALHRVIDPEIAMTIVDVGLVYGVTVGERELHVLLTMTSAACPVSDLIVEEVEAELDRVAPAGLRIRVDLVWEPPWRTDRMSERARRFMGW
jgi:metal-sulfur cluster biosynthetic enzyme